MAEGHHSEEIDSFKKDCCVICRQGFKDENPVTVSKKGVLTIISFSQKYERVDLSTYSKEHITTTPIDTVLVHKDCRRNFTDPKRVNSYVGLVQEPPLKRMRCRFFAIQLERRLYIVW